MLWRNGQPRGLGVEGEFRKGMEAEEGSSDWSWDQAEFVSEWEVQLQFSESPFNPFSGRPEISFTAFDVLVWKRHYAKEQSL